MPPRMESRTVLIFIASPYERGNKVRSSLRMKRAGLDESRLELKVGPGSAAACVYDGSDATDQSTKDFKIDAVHVLAVQFLFGRL